MTDPLTKKGRGRPREMPWDEWMSQLDVRLHLIRGVDFKSELISFRVHVHRVAKEYGLKAKTEKDITPEHEGMYVTFTKERSTTS
jgi:hypothetical protein